MADNANLMVIIGAQINDLKKGLDQASSEISASGNKWAGALKAAGVGLAAIGTAAVAAGAASVKSFADAGDEIQKLALKTGFSTETISELKYAADLSGASIDTVATAVKGTANFLQLLGQGSATAVADMDALGLSVEQLQGLSSEDTFNLLGEAIAGIDDPLQKAAIAQDVFGKAGIELLPMLADGADGMAALRQEARDLGLVFSQDAADNAAAFNDALSKLQGAFSGIMNQIGASLIPALMPLIDVLTDLVKALPLEQISELISSLLPPLAEALLGILQALPIDEVVQFVTNALSPLLKILPRIIEALSPIIGIFGRLIAAIPIGPLMELVMSVLEPLLIPALELVVSLLDALMPLIELVMGLITGLMSFLTPILTTVAELLGTVVDWISGALSTAIKAVVGFFTGAGDNIKKNWQALSDFFSNFWEGLKNGFKAAVNFLIGLAEGWANFWIKAVNFIIGALNKINVTIPDWVPLLGGNSFGINITPIPEVSLPRLAEGGTFRTGGVAMVGEAGPEIATFPAGASVIPLNELQPSYVFNVSFPNMVVRSESDINRIAIELQRVYERAQRTGR
jgi:hypothetical protein